MNTMEENRKIDSTKLSLQEGDFQNIDYLSLL